jgi:hypothetical protein
MKAVRTVILALLVIFLISIVMRWQRFPFAAVIMLVSLNIFSIVMIAQTILTAVKIKDSLLKITGLVCSIGLAIAGIGNLFRFLFWPFWPNLLFISFPTLITGGVMIFFSYGRPLSNQEESVFLKKNILLPWVVITVITALSLLSPWSAFYYTFHSKRDIQTYEDYLKNDRLSSQEPSKKAMNEAQ